MLNKILKHGTTIGIIISLIGFIISKSFSLSGELVTLIEKLYQITTMISVLFILATSSFINEKFDKILKIIGIILLIMFGMNLLSEFNIYKIESIETISLILFSGFYLMYLTHFRNKDEKIKTDYLKISFLTLVFIGGFLKLYDSYPSILKDISQILFWIVIIGILLNEYKKPKILRT